MPEVRGAHYWRTTHLARRVLWLVLAIAALISGEPAARSSAPVGASNSEAARAPGRSAAYDALIADGCAEDASVRPKPKCPCSGAGAVLCGSTPASVPRGLLVKLLPTVVKLGPPPYTRAPSDGVSPALLRPPKV